MTVVPYVEVTNSDVSTEMASSERVMAVVESNHPMVPA